MLIATLAAFKMKKGSTLFDKTTQEDIGVPAITALMLFPRTRNNAINAIKAYATGMFFRGRIITCPIRPSS